MNCSVVIHHNTVHRWQGIGERQGAMGPAHRLDQRGINTPKAIEVPETAMERRKQAGRMTQPWAMSLTLVSTRLDPDRPSTVLGLPDRLGRGPHRLLHSNRLRRYRLG
jgi:hypothetical protein